MLNKYFDGAVACELFSAAWCNLDCRYCYVPKHNQVITDKHKEIIEEVKQVDPLIDRLKRLYGDKLEILSHWGTEPSLTLHHFKDFYKKAIEVFPNLNTISFSSNFLQNTDKVVDFIKTFPKDRKFEFDVQLSLDGPKWVTDYNRRGGATEKIINNMVNFIKWLNEEEIFHTVKTHFKPTVSRTQYQEMLKDNNIWNYYEFFDTVLACLVTENTKKNVQISGGCDFTVVCPDDYTKQDGINFNKMYEEVINIKNNNDFKYVNPDCNYYSNMMKLSVLLNEFFTKQKMFTCSAADSQYGVSEYLNPCHDTFYHPYDAIKNAYLTDGDRSSSGHEVDNVTSGRIDLTRKTATKKLDKLTDYDLWKYQYNMRAFHDFSKFRISYAMAVIKEMAYCGQVSKCYENDEMAELLAIFTISRHSCPTGHLQYLGSKHLCDINYFKLFGNGLVENFLKRVIKEGICE